MAKIFNFLKRVLSKGDSEQISEAEAQRLRSAFKARYHNFKLLLSANNRALELMSEMEQTLRGNRPFGMSFIRTHCTGASVNVYRIITNLDQLAPDKYTGLYDRFKDIQEKINEVLSKRKETRGDKFVLPFSMIDKDMADQVGSKMANLGEVKNRLGMPVPEGFAISALAYERFFAHNDLQTEIERRLQSSTVEALDEMYALSADIQQLIIRSSVPEDLEREIMDAYGELEERVGANVRVSMRSSALGEDSAGTSFAGQYRSELNVSPDNIIQSYKEIVASKYNLQAVMYRLNRGILDVDVSMCVGCMAMVNAVAGGVIYSCNPLDIRDSSVFINSVWGLPKSVVDGSIATDLFVASRGEPPAILHRDIRTKDYKFVCYPDEGLCRLDLTGDRNDAASIEDAQAVELARMAVRLETYYGAPQDIEWAIDQEGAIHILQCRPLKQAAIAEAGCRAGEEPGAVHGEILLEGGVTASPGVACGPVFWLKKNIDALQFPEGAVMVASQALPRWAALLNRCSAVVTEQGSAAGHLANVAREFGVPALFGTPGVTDALQNGDLVTVDADGLRIYNGRAEPLLAKSEPRRNLMEGSQVYDILVEVMKLITPLNLLDPDSTDFRPRNCVTLHDITRFSHEKSVKEMFSFGNEHRFSERASKQLVCEFPMQWWVINLDDGFREDVPGKFVSIDNIVCIPMLALWEGIVAVPWEGPPPVDARGFMSVLMEATANPALDPSMPSPYANRNYFMVSRNFCSLSSRFGFHFSTIEALVGERSSENYVSFQLKGGAADFQRRLKRAQFVGDILEELGFRAEVKEDGVFARIEGYDEGFMKERLKILGYLIIHTRQLDMVMSIDGTAGSYRAKFIRDICAFADPACIPLSMTSGLQSAQET